MKRALAFLIMVLACYAVTATGRVETKPIELVYLFGGDSPIPDLYTGNRYGKTEAWDSAIARFQLENPNVVVKKVKIDLSTGSTLTIDAMVAAGDPPDIYYDMDGRVAKYMVAEFALPLQKYVSKKLLDDMMPSVLAACTRSGNVYALASSLWACALNVNTDLLAEAGYSLPEPKDWTIDEFLKMARLVKAKRPDAYATYLYAANQSSDQWWMGWFYAFGAKVYNPGDYSKTVLNSPQAVEALKFLAYLVANDYAPKNAAIIDDDYATDLWARGFVATGAMQLAHTAAMDGAVKQGTLKKPFKWIFTEFPHAPGVGTVPNAAGYSLFLGHKSTDEARNVAIGKFIEIGCGPEMVTMQALTGNGYSPLISAKFPEPKPYYNALFEIVGRTGVMDLGRTSTKFTAVRAQMYPLLQKLYMGQMTAEDVLKTYEANVNKILAD